MSCSFDPPSGAKERRMEGSSLSTYHHIQRSPFNGSSGTPSAPIGVFSSNIASGCDPAIAVIPGLMPRGYTLPSLAGFWVRPEQNYKPFRLITSSPTLTFIHSLIQTPPVNAAEQHWRGYKAEHCNQIQCVAGRCQRQR